MNLAFSTFAMSIYSTRMETESRKFIYTLVNFISLRKAAQGTAENWLEGSRQRKFDLKLAAS